MTSQFTRLTCVSFLGLATMSGCGPQTGPPASGGVDAANSVAEIDPHDMPLTEAEIESLKSSVTRYQDALSAIKTYRNAIRDAIAAGNPPQAHRPLDELDIVLEHLPTVARDDNIPKSEWETINTSALRIRELFDGVHRQIDAGEAPDFKSVGEEIAGQIALLENVASSE